MKDNDKEKVPVPASRPINGSTAAYQHATLSLYKENCIICNKECRTAGNNFRDDGDLICYECYNHFRRGNQE